VLGLEQGQVSLLFPRRAAPAVERRESPAWLQTIQRFRGAAATYDAGVPVSDDVALTHSGVYACVDLLADLVSVFPSQRFRDTVVAIEGTEHPSRERVVGPSVIETPADWMDPVNWKRVVMISWLLRGYAAGLVTSMRGVHPAKLDLLHPDRVSATRVRRDETVQWYLDGKKTLRWPLGPLWIAPGKMMHPEDVVGSSVLEFARQEAGMGIAARRFGAQWFRDGGVPTAILLNDKKFEEGELGEDGAKRVRERFLRAMSDRREPAVMTDGWKYQAIQVNPDESQFLESINASRAMIASFFRVPPWAIGAAAPSGADVQYTNVEHRGLDLLKFTVSAWVARMEQTLTALTPRPEYVKLNVDALLRTDLAARYRAHDTGIRAGFLTVNEVRALEDLPPVEGGDQLLWPPYRSALTTEETGGDPDQAKNAPANEPEGFLPGEQDEGGDQPGT
jgi:HK97 family phage portal protein